jgi:signal transduction histidine kinase
VSEPADPRRGAHSEPPSSAVPSSVSEPPISEVLRGDGPLSISDVAPAPPRVGAREHEILRAKLAELPLSQGLAPTARALVEAIRDAFPDVAVALSMRLPKSASGERLIASAGPETHAELGRRAASRTTMRALSTDGAPTSVSPSAPPERMFPEAVDEQIARLPVAIARATLHMADARPATSRDGLRDPIRRALLPQWLELAATAATPAVAAAVNFEMAPPPGDDALALRALQARVVQTEKLASIGQIAAKVVHELNNPLTAIVSYSDYLQRKLTAGPPDAQDFERLARIGEAAARILGFSRELTRYARPSEEESEEPIALVELVSRAVRFCEHVTDEAGIAVDLDADPSTPLIMGRRAQLTQVFVNLVTNASHAIQDAERPHGEGAIRIQVEPLVDGARVSIGDNGAGISPENVVRVFDPFFTTKRDGRGSGLGLSIVRSIVEAHRGRVWIRSAIGQGTTFVVDFRVR